MWILPALFLIFYQLQITFCICPDINLPEIIQFPETTATGTVIYNSNVTVNSTDSRWRDEGSGVAIIYNNKSSSYQLVLESQADLDKDAADRCGVKHFNHTYICLEERKQVMFTILDVNDYSAAFRQTSWRFISVDENAPSGTVLTTLKNRTIDRDCFSKYSFEVVSPVGAAPGEIKDHFKLDTEYNLVLAKPFDAENLKCQVVPGLQKQVKIELWEEDAYEKKKEATVTLTIAIKDLDDQEPMFVKPGCTNTCPPCVINQYDIEVTTSDMGTLNVTIKALDTDTTNSQILYSITKVEDRRYKNLFQINETTGGVSLIKPFAEILDGTDVVDDFIVELTILLAFCHYAMENNTGQMSDNVTLALTVIVPETTTKTITTTEGITTTVPPSTTTSKSSVIITSKSSTPSSTLAANKSNDDGSKDTLVIVLPIVAGILIIIIILIFTIRYKRNKAMIKGKYVLERGQRNGYVDTNKENRPYEGNNAIVKDAESKEDLAVEVDNPAYQEEESERGNTEDNT